MDDDEAFCFIRCCCCFILDLIVVVCVVSLVVWFFMFISNTVKFQIHDAELTRFDLDLKNNNLNYNLSLNFSIRNSNRVIGIHYHRFLANVYYSDQRFASVSVPPFYQGHKNTTVLQTVFQGQNLVLLDGDGRKKFEDDRNIGVYRIDVKVRIESRNMFGLVNTWIMKPIVRCHIKVPLSSTNSTRGSDVQSTKCHLGF